MSDIMPDNQPSFFDKFSPKTSYFLGFGSGLVVIIIVGFFVMLWMLLSGNTLADKLAAGAGSNQGNTAVVPTDNQPVAPLDVDFEISEADHVRGTLAAPVTIVEFSDFQCPYCSSFHPTLQRIVDEYGDKVSWVYKHFPLSSIHPEAQGAAEAAECAAGIGGNETFWAYSDSLFANQSELGRDLYLRLARDNGLDTDEFTACLDEGKYQAKVMADYQEGIAAGVRGTPGSFINGQAIPGAVPYEQVKSYIDNLLKG